MLPEIFDGNSSGSGCECMRLVFIGASRFGLACLENLEKVDQLETVGIITNRETFSISYRKEGVKNVNYVDLAPYASKQNIPLYLMQEKMSEPPLLETLRSWRPDFILVIGWYHMVPRQILELAPTAGLHSSLLPRYSGGAPLVWALIRDEKETGISFFLFDSGVDSGDILGQRKIPITDEDDIATLMAKIEIAGKDLVQETLRQWISGKILRKAQAHADREIMPQRSPEDGRIDWTQSARALFNFIRAQTRPYPGAFTDFRGERLYIWKSHEVLSGTEKKTSPVGEIFASDGQIRVICGDGKELVLHSLSWKGEHFSGPDFAQRFFR